MENTRSIPVKISKWTFVIIAALLVITNISWQKATTTDLTNTKWKGTLYAPDAYEGILEFTQDKAIAYVDNAPIETSTYKIKGDTIILKKISGGSPCGDELGKYIYTVKDNVLTFTVASDGCAERSAAFSPKGYTKQP